MKLYERVLENEEYAGTKAFLKRKNFPLYNYIFTFGLNEEEFSRYYPPNSIEEKKPNFYKIPEHPIGYTRTGEIICLPDFKVTKNIGIFGATGFGKGLLNHRIAEGLKYRFKYKGAIMNDTGMETIAWTGPMQTSVFKRKFHNLLEIERPFPVVHLLSTKVKVPQHTPSLKIKIPFDYFIENIWQFRDLQATKSYLNRINLKGCDSYEEFLRRLKEGFDVIQTGEKAKSSMIEKIISFVDEYIKQGIISFEKTVHDKIHLNIDDSIEDPMIQLMKCDVVPILVTQGLVNNLEFFPEYFAYRINAIFDYIDTHRKFKENNKFFLLIDELNTIISTKRKENVLSSIRRLFREGRWRNICTIGVAQDIIKIDDDILSNIKVAFTFNCGDEDKRKFGKEFNLKRDQIKKIGGLKLYEFIGKMREGKFIVYDNLSNRSYKTDYVEGFLLPPLSHHLPPSAKVFHFSLGGTEDNKIMVRGYATHILKKRKIYFRDKYKDKWILQSTTKENTIYKVNIREPYLIQGIDYSRAFNVGKLSTRDYNYFKERGYYIIKIKKEYNITNKESILMKGMVYEEMPKEVFGITYNSSKRRMRLFGKNCSKEWVIYE